jgi:hypothetical protein
MSAGWAIHGSARLVPESPYSQSAAKWNEIAVLRSVDLRRVPLCCEAAFGGPSCTRTAPRGRGSLGGLRPERTGLGRICRSQIPEQSATSGACGAPWSPCGSGSRGFESPHPPQDLPLGSAALGTGERASEGRPGSARGGQEGDVTPRDASRRWADEAGSISGRPKDGFGTPPLSGLVLRVPGLPAAGPTVSCRERRRFDHLAERGPYRSVPIPRQGPGGRGRGHRIGSLQATHRLV